MPLKLKSVMIMSSSLIRITHTSKSTCTDTYNKVQKNLRTHFIRKFNLVSTSAHWCVPFPLLSLLYWEMINLLGCHQCLITHALGVTSTLEKEMKISCTAKDTQINSKATLLGTSVQSNANQQKLCREFYFYKFIRFSVLAEIVGGGV